MLLGADSRSDLSLFDRERTLVVQGFYPEHQAVRAMGYQVMTAAEGDFDTAVVFLSRARGETHARIADAAARLRPGAALWVDGQKTDGIDAILKDLRSLAPVDAIQSRGHGKIFRVGVPSGLWLPSDWTARPRVLADGMVTRPGVFSADGPDPGSQMLAAALPARLPTRIVDLGAGWGWLSAHILTHEGVEQLHLVEADFAALESARQNVTDGRARFHWADALEFRLPEPVNGVIMNPPFHDGRAADPRLGAGFIRSAARLLTGAGRLWMVANRHLPYEHVLRECFADVAELAGDNRFKILTASGAQTLARRHPPRKGRKP